MKIDFQDRVVLVTGGTRGIGKRMVLDFLSAGAKVIATGQNPMWQGDADLVPEQTERFQYRAVSFENSESVEAFLNQIRKESRIDVCVNNAGINRLNYLKDTTDKDWADMERVNLEGPWKLSRCLLPLMADHGYGRIVNIASIYGYISRERRSLYTMTKYAVHGLTVASAIEYSARNVLINTLSPGFVLTDLTRKNLSAAEMASLAEKIPAGRLGTPEEISRVVLFLTSDMNTYLTGQNIIVDGGYVIT